jgi:Ca2+/Na+ antiporter
MRYTSKVVPVVNRSSERRASLGRAVIFYFIAMFVCLVLVITSQGKFTPVLAFVIPILFATFVSQLISITRKDARVVTDEIVRDLVSGHNSIQLKKEVETWRYQNDIGVLIGYSLFYIPEHLAEFEASKLNPPTEWLVIVKQLNEQSWNLGWKLAKSMALKRAMKQHSTQLKVEFQRPTTIHHVSQGANRGADSPAKIQESTRNNS